MLERAELLRSILPDRASCLLLPFAISENDEQEVDKSPKRGDECRDISEGGSVENLINAPSLFARPDDTHLLQDDLRTARGIKLYRQGDQLEQRQDEINTHRQQRQLHGAKEETTKENKGKHAGSELGHGHDCHAQLERRIALLVLDGVSTFVCGDAEGSNRRSIVNICRKAKPLVCRIVVIAEHVVDLNHIDIADVSRGQNLPRRLRTGHTGGAAICFQRPKALETRI